MPRVKKTDGPPFVLKASEWTGKRVKALRETFNLTQEGLSEITDGGISSTTIWRWEKDPDRVIDWTFRRNLDEIEADLKSYHKKQK